MQTTIFALFFALFAHIAFAIPPACLLKAVNTQDEPANMSAVCGDGVKSVQSYMANNCGNFESDAQKAFVATCSSAGTTIAAYTGSVNSTSNSTATATTTRSSSSSSATGTGAVTSSARTSGTATGSAGSTHSTAGANGYSRQGMGSMAAAAVALVGAVAAL